MTTTPDDLPLELTAAPDEAADAAHAAWREQRDRRRRMIAIITIAAVLATSIGGTWWALFAASRSVNPTPLVERAAVLVLDEVALGGIAA